MCGRVK